MFKTLGGCTIQCRLFVCSLFTRKHEDYNVHTQIFVSLCTEVKLDFSSKAKITIKVFINRIEEGDRKDRKKEQTENRGPNTTRVIKSI